MRLFLLTSLAMIAFAANSVLARVGLLGATMDAASYTAVRLVSGALMLAVLIGAQNARTESAAVKIGRLRQMGSWQSALALFAYAAAFSFAYVSIDAGLGALILFFSVQATMIGWGLFSGHRPHPLEWLGFVIASAAFIALVAPGATAPPAWSSLLMVISGAAWGAYSIRGASVSDPLAATAGNFVYSVPLAVLLILVFAPMAELSLTGTVAAILSGAICSALGYALWYQCLVHLTSSQAAIIQLSVPALATFGGVLFLNEALTVRLLVCSIAILGGVAVAISARGRKPR